MDDHEKCHDEFLFVDIEWNQKYGTYDIENREAIWIGIVAADENLECKKLFSKTITLEDIDSLTEETCKLVHIGRTNIMNAKSAKEICGKIRQSFPTYRYVVVWSLESYQLFRRTMKKAGVHMCRHKVVVLQEIIRNIAVKGNQCVEFEDALIHATIPYKKDYLHCPKHDVKYLHALFRKLYFAYMNLTSSEMNAVNAKSKTIHTMKCRHGYSENSEVESGEKRLLFYRYRPCKCCWSEDEWRKFSWKPTLSKDTSESKVEEAKTKVQEKCPSNRLMKLRNAQACVNFG